MRERHLSNKILDVARATVIGLGSEVPGHPAFINCSNWRSFTMFIGLLLSAHHLAMWALIQHVSHFANVNDRKTDRVSSVVCARWEIDTVP
jgi:hypothetical protein